MRARASVASATVSRPPPAPHVVISMAALWAATSALSQLQSAPRSDHNTAPGGYDGAGSGSKS